MADFYLYADFPAGEITERLVDYLSALSAHDFADLMRSKKIVVPKKETSFVQRQLTHHNLRWSWISEYARACNISLSAIIFGQHTAPKGTRYSAYDDAVIALLNQLDPATILAAGETVRFLFANPRFRIARESTPSAKIIAIATAAGKLPTLVSEENLWQYRMDINDEIARFRQYRRKERFVFRLDYILDLCTYFHLSPHWVFSLTGPLLCQTAEADDFFDMFCLLSQTQQVQVIAMLVNLCPNAQTQLSPEMKQQIGTAISWEGGNALC